MNSEFDSHEDQSIHFTYAKEPDMSLLCQGDVLKKTNELMDVLKEVHPYFLNEGYKYFIVLSQSCDLVCRNGKNCKTPYITIAAVRGYSDFLERTLTAKKYAENFNGFLLVDTHNLQQITQLVERLYNNTEPDYFFLYKDDALGFSESMVAYLKVSIALKSNIHYKTLLSAKVLELDDTFKAKLGWLVGNMYSRVGTVDWESEYSSSLKKQYIQADIHNHCVLGAKVQLKELKKKYAEGKITSHDSAIEFLSTVVVKSKYDELIETIEDTIIKTPGSITLEEREKLLNAFKSSHKIKQIMNSSNST